MSFVSKSFVISAQPRWLRSRLRVLLLSVIAFSITVWLLSTHKSGPVRISDEADFSRKYPYTYKHVHTFKKGLGGAWYIPPNWIDDDQPSPENIIEAIRLASKAVEFHPERHIPFSNIPLMMHQKWDTTHLLGTNEMILSYMETWLIDAISPPPGSNEMAYFLWDNKGVLTLMEEYEHDLVGDFIEVFSPVEKVDIFRIAVCKWFGGIYGDVDTKSLKHPSQWIHIADISTWTDEMAGKSYGLDDTTLENLDQSSGQPLPVNAIWGIECDTDPNSNAHWRMAYTYPVQLTNWAFASASNHPILQYFLDCLKEKAAEARDRVLKNPGTSLSELHYDPVTRTGPVAVTEATNWWLEKHDGLRWNALTGLNDGGKTKLVGDVLILPITGFSPTEEKNSRMGEKSFDDPDARLAHKALGSWHHTNIIVEYGKFCRSFFGLCKDWPKMW